MRLKSFLIPCAVFAVVFSCCAPALAVEETAAASEPKEATLNGLVKQDGALYCYDNGIMLKKKWKTVKKKTYYFGKSGKAVTGKKKISHYYCYFGDDAVLDRKINLNKKLVALTYDDGPSQNTESILATLKKHKSVATFFVVGNRITYYKSTVKKAVKQGSEIANHSWSHASLTSIGNDSVKSQVSKTNKAVKKLTGQTITLLRPPGGGTSSRVSGAVGMPQILWDVDTLDWKTQSSSSTINSVLKEAKDGSIVLMHDLYSPTANATKTIVPKLIKKGFQLVTVSELADCKKIKLKKGKVYYNMK